MSQPKDDSWSDCAKNGYAGIMLRSNRITSFITFSAKKDTLHYRINVLLLTINIIVADSDKFAF